MRERHKVLELTQDIRDKGVAVIFISHDIHMVYDICDRVVILESGKKIGDYARKDIGAEEVVRIIREGQETAQG